MAILIHVEISKRELDSKLLLAVIAARTGRSVLLGDVIMPAKLGIFRKFIFHTKSLTPSDELLRRHERIRKNGGAITSLDEEGNLVEHGYAEFALQRFSTKSLEQATRVFCWGAEDFQTLGSLYPDQKEKLALTGSPRADLWMPIFSKYWQRDVHAGRRPYLLISSNFGIQRMDLPKKLRNLESLGYLDRDPERLGKAISLESQRLRTLGEFLNSIRLLSGIADEFDIVVRPHPREDVDSWKLMTREFNNVLVAGEGAISEWLSGAFSLVHNGCTTALEATISGKPVIAFTPFENTFLSLPNELGQRAECATDLLELVQSDFSKWKAGKGDTASPADLALVKKKIYLRDNGLAAEEIVSDWTRILQAKKVNFFQVMLLRLMFFQKRLRRLVREKVSGRRQEADYKFPPLSRESVLQRIRKIEQLLGYDSPVRVQFVGEKTVLVSPRES